MNLHQALVQAWTDLLNQGAFGMTPNGRCEYLTPDGKSCIAGLFLKRQAPGIDLGHCHGSIDLVLSNWPTAFKTLATDLQTSANELLDTLLDAQAIHDRASERQGMPLREALCQGPKSLRPVRLSKTPSSPSTPSRRP